MSIQSYPVAAKHGANIITAIARGNVVAKALCYKPESRGFEPRWSDYF
jgi:hypothetical protein